MSNRRFEMHQYRHIIHRMRMGESDRTIAKTGLIGRRKAGELRQIVFEQGWLNPGIPIPDDSALSILLSQKPKGPSLSLIKPYAKEVQSWHASNLSGVVMHQTLVRNHNFKGSYSAVRRYLQSLEKAHPKVTTILDFAPGEAAQVDFGSGPNIIDVYTGEVSKTWFFVMTLAFSRHMYVELVKNQKVDTWLLCHRHAFEFFGGVPKKIIIDNLKSAITKACFHDPEVQRSYAEYAEGYGFVISPCPPADPKKKGIVESGVKYVKNNFMPLRQFRSVHDSNVQAKEWVLEKGNRIHGTTKQQPLKVFVETEKSLLKTLPDRPPELGVWAQVKLHGNCHVQFEKCYYSAPFRLVHQILWLKATGNTVKLFRNLDLVAIHPRLYKPGSRSTLNEHLPPNALAYKMQDPTWCRKQAEQIGPACLALIEQLFSDKVLDNLRACQGIIRLSEKYGNVRLEAACQRALSYGNPRYYTVKTILQKGLDQEPKQRMLFSLSAIYTGKSRFCRDSQALLKEASL